MATLPDTVPTTTATNLVSAAAPKPSGNNLVNGFNGLNFLRQIGLLVGLAASIAIGFAVVIWSQEPEYRPLLGEMSGINTNQAIDVLQANDIVFKIDSKTGNLLVAAKDIYNARLKLASIGITNDKNIGYELLDRDQGLGTSQFMENISYRRGLEGELARTITHLKSIRAARVHLALPKTSVFIRDTRKPSASIFVELISGRSLRQEQISAIINLVASSVPELDQSEVHIIDQNGRLFSIKNESEESVAAANQFEYTRKMEEILTKRINRILRPIVGIDRFQVEVSADVNFTLIEQTDEIYNPDLLALRSEQVSEEKRSNSSLGGVPGALSNQPPAAATAPEQVTANNAGTGVNSQNNGNSRSQSTRNYELDKTISYTKHQQGQIRRLSVAVVVDNPIATNTAIDGEGADAAANGEDTETPTWSPEELNKLENLVKGAMGYDVSRGDSVVVINSSFTKVEFMEVDAEEVPIWMQDWFHQVIKQVLAGIMVLILVFVVLKPIMKNLANIGVQQQALITANAAPAITEYNAAAPLDNSTALLAGPGQNQNYGNDIAAVQGVVANDPQQAAQVIRKWVNDDE